MARGGALGNLRIACESPPLTYRLGALTSCSYSSQMSWYAKPLSLSQATSWTLARVTTGPPFCRPLPSAILDCHGRTIENQITGVPLQPLGIEAWRANEEIDKAGLER